MNGNNRTETLSSDKDFRLEPSLEQTRHRIVNGALVALALFGLPAVMGSILRARDVGWHDVMLLHIVAFVLLALAALLRNRLSYFVRAFTVVVVGYLIGLAGLTTWGLVGMGIVFLFSASAMATVFFGLWAGFWTAVVSTATIAVVGLGFITGKVVFDFDIVAYAFAPSSWLTAVAAFGFFMAIVVVSLGHMYQAIEKGVLDLQDHSRRLEAANTDLIGQMELRRKAEAQLRESEEKYRLLVENAADAICIVCEQRVRYANPFALEVLGYTQEELEEIPFTDLLHPEDRDMANNRHGKRLDGTLDSRPFLYRFLSRDGTEIYAQLSGVPLEWEGKPALLIMARDMSSQVDLENKLRRTERLGAIGTLAGGVAHDFNNLLMGIQGNLSLMKLELEKNNPSLQRVRDIEQCVREATGLTRQLLGFARGGKYESRPIVVGELLDRSLAMFGRTHKQIKVEKDLPKTRAIEADPGQLEQVFLNLFVNAQQAMPDGGVLAVACRDREVGEQEAQDAGLNPGSYVEISVQDTGVGMEAEVLDHAFDPFFTTRQMGRGTGLGLASTHGIVKNHGGAIEAASEPGKGSVFTIFLPASDRKALAEPLVRREIVPGEGSVLLVDDDEMIVQTGRGLLEAMGYNVLTASSAREVREILENPENDPDLVIMDMVLPNTSHFDLFELIKNRRPSSRVLLCSGYSIDVQAQQILNQGCDGFIQKPFNMEELSQKVCKVLEGDPGD